MDKMLEFEILVILQDDQTQKWEDMGIIPSEDNMEQRFVKYAFDPSTIVEMRQTFVKYKEEWLDAVVCTLQKITLKLHHFLYTIKNLKEY